MYNRPNSELILKNSSISNPYSYGNNQLRKKFKQQLEVILCNNYYEGTNFGRYYRKLTKEKGDFKYIEQGKEEFFSKLDPEDFSAIYVPQPKYEKRLYEEFIEPQADFLKYLVGYTGVGKTTLIRNVFSVFDRKIVEKNNNLIIYISFFSIAVKEGEAPSKAIENCILSGIEMASTHLSGYTSNFKRKKACNEEFYEKLYEFIESNNEFLTHKPEENNHHTDLTYESEITRIMNETPMDYYLSVLKFYIHEKYVKEHIEFNNVFFIFDDIETQPPQAQDYLIVKAQHIIKCLSAYRKRHFSVKVLIAARNYTIRLWNLRMLQANRIDKKLIIMKDGIPSLSDILDKRLEYIEDKKIGFSGSHENYKKLVTALKTILKGVYSEYDSMILNLTHYDIFTSMLLLQRIFTNKKYFGKYEFNKNGAFTISIGDYQYSKLSNEDVFYSLVYGEQDYYYDYSNYYMTNILHFHAKEKAETELLGIYIIHYLNHNKYRMGGAEYDGVDSVEVTKIRDIICSLFDLMTENEIATLKKGFDVMLSHLYRGGVLLQSIINPVSDDSNYSERQYSEALHVYLSLRGWQLYQMLQSNSLLLETYRDDIDTELPNNTVNTLKLSKRKNFIYCLNYIKYLAEKEAVLFSRIGNKYNYNKLLGNRLAITVILEGLYQSLKTYFIDNKEDKTELFTMYNDIADFVIKLINDYGQGYYFVKPQLLQI